MSADLRLQRFVQQCPLGLMRHWIKPLRLNSTIIALAFIGG
jgi:hypothetical protein